MRAVRILATVVAGLVLLLVLALVGIWLFVDPNDYKDRIAAEVQSSTGRELTLEGDIDLAIFPWLALELGPASLGNPPGFGAEPFATVQRARARVKLFPLLRGNLQVGRIEVDGLDLRLATNAEGRGNWEFGDGAEPGSSEPSKPLDLAGVEVTRSRIAFEDLVAQEVELRTGRLAPGVVTPVTLSLQLVTEPGAAPMPLEGRFDAALDLDAQNYRLTDLRLSGSLPPEDGGKPLPWSFASPEVALDLVAQTLSPARFEAAFASAKMAGSLQGSRIIDAPSITGDFTLSPVALRTLLSELDIEPPVTRDAAVLGTLEAAGRFAYEGDAVRAEGLTVKLDDTRMEGRFGANLDSGLLEFDLTLDTLNADRYLPPAEEESAGGGKPADDEPFELPVEVLKPLLAKGTLAIDQLRFADMNLTEVRVGVDARDGVTRIAPAEARLYGGRYAGEVAIDTRPAQPRVTLQQSLTGIDIAAFMNDFLETKRLAGRGNVTARLTADGTSGDDLIRTLSGRIEANLADGAVEGIDLWYAIAQAQSLIKNRALAGGTNTGRTAFDTFRASADIAGGVATTRDLAIASSQLRVTGAGTTNLATQAIDYDVKTTVLKAPPGADGDLAGLALAEIPIGITGTLDAPKVRPDLEGIAKARVKQEIEKRKDEVKEKIQDRLRDLLNR